MFATRLRFFVPSFAAGFGGGSNPVDGNTDCSGVFIAVAWLGCSIEITFARDTRRSPRMGWEDAARRSGAIDWEDAGRG